MSLGSGSTQGRRAKISIPFMKSCRRILVLFGLCLPMLGAEKANIIFIVADDLGYGELASYGGRDVPTP